MLHTTHFEHSLYIIFVIVAVVLYVQEPDLGEKIYNEINVSTTDWMIDILLTTVHSSTNSFVSNDDVTK